MDEWELSPEEWDRLRWRPLRLGRGSFWLRASMTGGGGPCSFFQSYTDICLTTEKKHGKPQSVSPVSVRYSSCVFLAAFWGVTSTSLLIISPPRLPVGDYSQTLVSTSVFEFAELRCSLHRLTLNQRFQSMFWSGRRRMFAWNPR
jgi:hypothetical protein